MKNKLIDLNNYLFEQIEKINDDELQGEELEKVIRKAETINKLAENIIKNGELALKTVSVAAEYGLVAPDSVPQLLGIEKKPILLEKKNIKQGNNNDNKVQR